MINWGNTTRYFNNIECPISKWIISNRIEEYAYSLDIELDNIKETGFAFVTFDESDVNSNNFAPVCETLDGIVRIFAKHIPFKNIKILSIAYVEQ